MARYENVEGRTAKFWEIDLEGANVTTREGRIRSGGESEVRTTSTKHFKSADEARWSYEAAVFDKAYPLQLRPHPLLDGMPREQKRSAPRLPAHVREAEKVEGLRRTLTAPRPALGRVMAGLDETRLVRVQFQRNPSANGVFPVT